jgi:NADPH-dependent curcumin reductase
VTAVNTQCRLAARPTGLPKAPDWAIVDGPMPAAANGEFVVEIDYLSIDPAMRTWMNAGRSYVPPVEIGEVMRAFAVGRVIESHHPEFAVGDQVSGLFGVQNYAVSDGAGVNKIDTTLAPATAYLAALGISGLTAYFGLLDIGRPEPGQTVLVSGAAGSVGNVVGQIAKINGCRAVGIAGGEHKCRFLLEQAGFDAAIDYKTADLRAELKRTHPMASTSSSTMSAAWRSRPLSTGWRAAPVSCSAARCRSTTTPRADRRTTCSYLSRAPQ